MKKTLVTALALAAIGSQVANAASASMKVGVLTFALTDTYQGPSSRGVTAVGGGKATNTVANLAECTGNYKYQSSTITVNNSSILRAISSAYTGTDYKQVGGSGNGLFTTTAKLVIFNYDNVLSAPPYPPYLPALNGLTMADTWNGPRVPQYDSSGSIDVINQLVTIPLAEQSSTWSWPNLKQIDWVDYDAWSSELASLNSSLWPKAYVYVSDPRNGNSRYACTNVSPFFSFEEAYCYFCWDTVDRVTDGKFSTGTSEEICIGSSCGTTGSGTTRWYMTIKFNNDNTLNDWLNRVDASGNLTHSWLGTNYTKSVPAEAVLSFTVAGVVNYPWTVKTVDAIRTAYGTMTMSQANGFASNPWCGVLRGSVKIVETTDSKVPVACDAWYWDENSRPPVIDIIGTQSE